MHHFDGEAVRVERAARREHDRRRRCRAEQQDQPGGDRLKQLKERRSGATLSRWETMRAPGAIARARAAIGWMSVPASERRN